MKVNQIKAGSILAYIETGINVCVSLLYTPIMIKCLGQSEYGLYNVVTSTISMLSILDFGINSGYVKFFSKYKQNKDKVAIEKLNGLYLILFSIIGLITVACGWFLVGNLSLLFSTGLTSTEYELAKELVTIAIINLAFSFPMGVFQTIIAANEKFIFIKCLGIVKALLGPFISIPLLFMGFGSIIIVSVSFIITFSINIACGAYVFWGLRYRFVFCNFEHKIIKTLFAYSFFIFLNVVIEQINYSVDGVLLGRYKGTIAVSVYSVGMAIDKLYRMLSGAISSVFIPRIHNIVNRSNDLVVERKELTNLFVKVGRIQFLILMLVLSGVIFFGKSFILNFWAGREYTDSYYVALLLMIPATVPLIQNIGIEIQRAKNIHQFRSIIYFFIAIINILISINLCQRFGAIGSALGTFIAVVIGHCFVMNIFYHKRCNIDIVAFWKSILSMTKGFILPTLTGTAILYLVNTDRMCVFVLAVVLYMSVYCVSVWRFSMNDSEKDLVRIPVKKVVYAMTSFLR